jgi:hypothetical protein
MAHLLLANYFLSYMSSKLINCLLVPKPMLDQACLNSSQEHKLHLSFSETPNPIISLNMSSWKLELGCFVI